MSNSAPDETLARPTTGGAERRARVDFDEDELTLVGELLTVENSDYALCVLDEIQEHHLHAGPAATALAKVAEATDALAEPGSVPSPQHAESLRGQVELAAGQCDGDGARALVWKRAPTTGTTRPPVEA